MKKCDRGDLAAFFYGFILWVAESAAAEGIPKLYFLTREGEFLKSLYEETARLRFPGKKLPAADVLEVSRLSTFLPSCSQISLEACMRIWNQYETQSMAALMKSFHIKPDSMQQYFARYNIHAWEEIKKPWEDRRVQALFQDQAFIYTVTQEKETRKKLLYKYLAGKGFCGQMDGPKVGIVDIGWRGTIQDNLCYLYPDCEMTGFYMGLQPFLSPQPPNSRKYGYLNKSQLCGQILMFVTPLEMLCNSPNGSTVSYREQDGGVMAVKKKDQQENAVFFQYTQKKQQEIASGVKKYCRLAAGRGRKRKRNQLAYRAIYRFVAWPDRETAHAYFSLKHDETFGMGCCLDKRKTPGLRHLWKMLPVFYQKDVWISFLKQTTWPQGYFVKYRLYPLLAAYNAMLLFDTIKKARKCGEGSKFHADQKSHIQARN